MSRNFIYARWPTHSGRLLIGSASGWPQLP